MNAALASAIDGNSELQAAWSRVEHRLDIAPDETQPRAAVRDQLHAQRDGMSLDELAATLLVLKLLPEDPVILPPSGFAAGVEGLERACDPRAVHPVLATIRRVVAEEREAQRLYEVRDFAPELATLVAANDMPNITETAAFYQVPVQILRRLVGEGLPMRLIVELKAFYLRAEMRKPLDAKAKKRLRKLAHERAMHAFYMYEISGPAFALGLIDERQHRESRYLRERDFGPSTPKAPLRVDPNGNWPELRKIINAVADDIEALRKEFS